MSCITSLKRPVIDLQATGKQIKTLMVGSDGNLLPAKLARQVLSESPSSYAAKAGASFQQFIIITLQFFGVLGATPLGEGVAEDRVAG